MGAVPSGRLSASTVGPINSSKVGTSAVFFLLKLTAGSIFLTLAVSRANSQSQARADAVGVGSTPMLGNPARTPEPPTYCTEWERQSGSSLTHIFLRRHIARDEGLDHLAGAVGLRTRFGDPLVFAALEHVELALAAGRPIRRGEFLLHGREHVVVERALHDQHRRERHRLAALEYLLRIAFVRSSPTD